MAHAPTVIWQKQAYVELLLDRDFFFQGCLVACEGNQTWRLVWVNQSVSSRQLSQVEEPDPCTAFTEPGGTVEEFSLLSFHQSKGTWEKMWEKGCWWGRVGRGQEEEKQSQRWKLNRTRAATVRKGSDQVRPVTQVQVKKISSALLSVWSASARLPLMEA